MPVAETGPSLKQEDGLASIDVVIPCYNYAHFLPACVASVQAQNVDGLRVIIIDNASTDDSVAVARELAAQDPRIEVICHENNLGPHASYNEAIDRAEADYFMILCADDILIADSLRHGIEMMEQFPRVSCVVGTVLETLIGNTLPDMMRQPCGRELVEGSTFIEQCCAVGGQNVYAHAMLVRTSVQKSVGYYRPALPQMDDLEMALRLAARGIIGQLDRALATRRLHNSNLSQSLWNDHLKQLSEREAVFTSFFAREGKELAGAEKMHRAAQKYLAEMAFWSAISHIVRGRAQEGLAIFRLGLKLSPFSMLLPLGYLYRTEGALKRASSVISGAFLKG